VVDGVEHEHGDEGHELDDYLGAVLGVEDCGDGCGDHDAEESAGVAGGLELASVLGGFEFGFFGHHAIPHYVTVYLKK